MKAPRKTKAPDNTVPQKTDRVFWHPAFVEALRLELEPYLNDLDFLVEKELAGAPLKIDVVVEAVAKLQFCNSNHLKNAVL